ncbi:chemotaxis-specific protein-glutamate methyltransferase CheB [Halovenus sp. WSH3]|uniref:Protein-glutamate methylesterase/protein-glutamine glutaminase n=1 Tax=Halovenus carboxidivorans TaxID=2692199 RepID=A0A6B0T425_9EURY|nr:chemotaxis-specific protein-glutamate methyltransferase CheB [Halovenus carboxidivorans]MXR50926.1 chemotaxis-specific protein-glutamate methyltransferase CheB [Halovenus carboxidivorans]
MAEVAVVDDSQFMRVQIREILEEGGHTVVAEAENGKTGVAAVREHRPDVVTMDVKMPGMDGIEAVSELMSTDPTPVLMLSRYTEEGADTTLDALDAGAVDFMRKPDGEVTASLVEYADDLVELVSVVARADVGPTQAESGGASVPAEAAAPVTTPERLSAPDLAAAEWKTPPTLFVAASTGGPSEIQTVLGALPGTVGLRTIIVQHMPEQFTDRFAARLDKIAALDVREATDGDRVGPNEAVVARGGHHLELDRDLGDRLLVSLTDDPPVHSVRPAADVTLESGANAVDGRLVGVVLSGMGRDGAAGAERIADAGGTVLAQKPETASIGSMPEHAIETGAVDGVHPPEKLPEAILDALDSARL